MPSTVHYLANKIGVSFSWGMETFGTYPNTGAPVGTFNPTNLNFDQWMQAALAAGAKYVSLTVQHASGFVLTETATTTYKSTNTGCPKPQDILAGFYNTALKYGLDVVVYLGNQGNNNTENAKVVTLITEILTNFPKVIAIWFDHYLPGVWTGGGTAAAGTTNLMNAVHAFPNVLFIHNDAQVSLSTSDLFEYEGGGGTTTVGWMDVSNHVGASEVIDTVFGNVWFWQSSGISLVPWQNIALSKMYCLRAGANYLINVGPDTRGLLPNDQVDFLENFNKQSLEMAMGKTATASSSFDGSHGPDKTVVGLPVAGQYWISNTGDMQPYDEVDLGATVTIRAARSYCVGGDGASVNRLRDLTFFVYDASHTLVYTSSVVLSIPAANTETHYFGEFIFPNNIQGRYLRCQRNTVNFAGPWGDGANPYLELTAFHVLVSASIGIDPPTSVPNTRLIVRVSGDVPISKDNLTTNAIVYGKTQETPSSVVFDLYTGITDVKITDGITGFNGSVKLVNAGIREGYLAMARSNRRRK